MRRSYIPKDVPIVSATKGIEIDSLMLMNEVLEDELTHRDGQLAFLSGPSSRRSSPSQHPPRS